MSFDAIIRGTWSPEEIAELRTEAEWWESYDGLPVEDGWEPGAGRCRCTLPDDLNDRIRAAREGYREAMASQGVELPEIDPDAKYLLFETYGEPGYGKTFLIPPDDTVLYEGSFGPVYMGLDEYNRFLYGEDRREDEEEDIEWPS